MDWQSQHTFNRGFLHTLLIYICPHLRAKLRAATLVNTQFVILDYLSGREFYLFVFFSSPTSIFKRLANMSVAVA